jgi:hypothetical protein
LGRRISHAGNKHEALLATCFMLVSCLAYSSSMMMEVTFSSDTIVDFQQTMQHYATEDKTVRTIYIYTFIF